MHGSSLTPLAPHQDIFENLVDDFKPPYNDYLLGPDILVSPITANSTTNTTDTKVRFLAGASWSYWFNSSFIVKGACLQRALSPHNPEQAKTQRFSGRRR